jgi:uncharacterized metal-binding protein YceD (DUF177 family)
VKPRAFEEFEINLIRLKNGEHDFTYNMSNEFFQSFSQPIIEDGKGKAFLKLNKSESMIQLDFRLELEFGLVCDVSLKPFVEKIISENTLIIKFGEAYEELSEDVIIVPNDITSLNVAQYINEYATLELPMKCIHPELRDEERPEFVYVSETTEDETTDEDSADPRWEALKKLKKD